ncbi:hypothetical protein MMPV_001408 [Pyropia vietnamensis]
MAFVPAFPLGPARLGRPAGLAAGERSRQLLTFPSHPTHRAMCPPPPRCGTPEDDNSGGGADEAPPPPPPRPLSPSAAAAAASRLGSGGTSRYEAFYRPAAGAYESPALDVTAVPCVSTAGDGDGDTPPSNPFFVGYPEEELAALWAIHQDVVGARPDAADESEDGDARGRRGGGGSGGGAAGGEGPPGGEGAPAKLGLHETILQALEGGGGGASSDGDSP